MSGEVLASLLSSSVQLIQEGGQGLEQAAKNIASGKGSLSTQVLELSHAQNTSQLGVSLARGASRLSGRLIDLVK